MRFFKLLPVIFFMFLFQTGQAQMLKDESKWTFEAKKKTGNKYDLIVHLKLPKDWHIYSFNPGGDGSLIPPVIKFKGSDKVKLEGKVKESGKLITETVDGIDGAIHMFKGNVDYTQSATITGNTTITGTYMYQICNEQTCLPPTADKPFKIDIKDAGDGGAGGNGADAGNNGGATTAAVETTKADTATTPVAGMPAPASADTTKKAVAAGDKTEGKNGLENKSLLALFLISLGSGIAAIFTPCIFSMIPVTVSFFTKRSKTKQEGIRNAIIYSLSIIVIFTLLGVMISAIFGPAKLNEISSNWIANLVFFVMIIFFAFSFLGAYEITLPSSWTSATDSKAGTGSVMGIFFMALTLAIVSFSCTGPVVGPLLVLASKGGIAGPTVGMFGFSLGLSLPFALFAVFPGLLNKMASSGGWLNQVKVVLGFIELMLALKFLSNADLQKGWRLLDREIFIALWVVLSVLTAAYLMGWIKLSHDDEPAKNIYGQNYVNTFKLILSITFFTFAVYLIPGMWGAPLNGMSAFVPPMGTFDEFGGTTAAPAASSGSADKETRKYYDILHKYEGKAVKQLGLETYFDYNEALAASKKQNKPLMLDFTGITCINCRKMEGQVWAKPEVAKRLKEDFIVVSLFCDAYQVALPKEEQFFSKELGKQVETLGDYCSYLQVAKFASAGQPYYFYTDAEGNKLADGGYGYDPDVEKFVNHLDKVKAKYKELHP